MNSAQRWIRHGRLVFVLALSALFLGGAIYTSAAPNGKGNGKGPANEGPPGLSGGGPPGQNGGGPPGQAKKGNGIGKGGPHGKDSLSVVARPSQSSAVEPFFPGNASHNWRYVFCLPAGSTFIQSFPLEFTLDDTNDNEGDTVEISIDPVGRLAEQANVPIPFDLTDDGNPEIKYVDVETEALDDGAYTLNLQIRATPARRVQHSHLIVHIHVLVGSACGEGEDESPVEQPTGTTENPPHDPSDAETPLEQQEPPGLSGGFFTDSGFNLLQNCDGQDVDGSAGGTFEIVARPKSNLIVATNPGTFYLNLIWPNNTGNAQGVTIGDLIATNLVPKGANAVHAFTFDSEGFTGETDGTPCGPAGPCTLEVPGGESLWLNWHLVFELTGQSADGIGNECGGANTVPISARATLTDGNGDQLTSTTVAAAGHLKK